MTIHIVSAERRIEIDKQMTIDKKHIEDLTDTYIKKLAVSTGIYDCITDPYDALENGDVYSSVMPDLVRFAELIVAECADICTDNYYTINGFGITEADQRCHDLIKSHFGVKE